jgi:hypothetical protein
MSIPGTDHDLHLQQPDVLYAAIADFLTPLQETAVESSELSQH